MFVREPKFGGVATKIAYLRHATVLTNLPTAPGMVAVQRPGRQLSSAVAEQLRGRGRAAQGAGLRGTAKPLQASALQACTAAGPVEGIDRFDEGSGDEKLCLGGPGDGRGRNRRDGE